MCVVPRSENLLRRNCQKLPKRMKRLDKQTRYFSKQLLDLFYQNLNQKFSIYNKLFVDSLYKKYLWVAKLMSLWSQNMEVVWFLQNKNLPFSKITRCIKFINVSFNSFNTCFILWECQLLGFNHWNANMIGGKCQTWVFQKIENFRFFLRIKSLQPSGYQSTFLRP